MYYFVCYNMMMMELSSELSILLIVLAILFTSKNP